MRSTTTVIWSSFAVDKAYLQELVLVRPDGKVVNAEQHPLGVTRIQPQQQLCVF